LLPALKNSLQNAYHADFCVGYLNLRGQLTLADWVFVVYAVLGSKTEAFRREVLAWGKPVCTLRGMMRCWQRLFSAQTQVLRGPGNILVHYLSLDLSGNPTQLDHQSRRLAEEDECKETTLFWRGDPEAQLRCSPDGQLYLTGVELPSWQGIELPRQWDSPDRPQDDDTEEQLESLFECVRASLQVWAECLPYLESS
jgi:hypothetical protein